MACIRNNKRKIFVITVTPQQAEETYRLTVVNEPRENWPTWVRAINNSLACGEWIGGNRFESFAKEVFDELIKTNKPAMADSK